MPLLGGGRHKSASAAPSPTPLAPERGQQQQVCESPLFGIRKQLPMNQEYAANTLAGGGGQRATPSARHSQQQATALEISSVPHQISRQQIHYAFAIMDTNADGMLDVRDLSRTLANLGLPIDESILGHLMSRLSKQGEHRISEDEFLSWIADFIQVNDSGHTTPTASHHHQQRQAPVRPHNAASSRRQQADNSLSAGQPEAALRNGRRGSGSGLALMRALTSSKHSSAASAASAASTSVSSPPSSPTSKSAGAADWQVAACEAAKSLAEAEARKDLRAAFCVFDLDGDGFITLEEVAAGLKLLGEHWTPLEVRQVFSQCQLSSSSSSSRRTGSGTERISIEQFIQMLL